ncbi:hypothetical protein [Leptolyngbya sp. NIES-2104]|uniref:hypothetical protein n=1 Tax=Leptolyngbya sp. NIES-2104 TaxID=1552121 RepID=UPI0006EC9059|nr:hypothetical protein [Leptolyngbya sp. NIES-2104]GAP94259.1 hypothetical protein NIES2104_07700 [Leptolyngbya sp. NIES-2104]
MFKKFLQFKPLRVNIPALIDIVMISDPEQIKNIEASGDVDRLHAYETKDLPWWVRFFFKASKFHDVDRDLWFCPFESTSNPTYSPRRAYLEAKSAEGYSQEDIQQIAELLRTNADDDTLAHAMVQVVNRRFFGEEVPNSITQAAKHTVQKLGETIFPWKYQRGRKSQQQIMEYCTRTLPPDVHLVDAGHNIGEVVQATAGSLKTLKHNLDQSIEKTFTAHPPTPQVSRIAVKASTLGGILAAPTTPGKTVVAFNVGKAATQTQDILFTFGTGRSERSCVFKDFFLGFMTDLQKELRSNR